MKLNKDTNILIIGLGVIGGGYAKALTNAGYKVNCITKEQKDIDYALSRGMIAKGSCQIDKEMIGSAELVIFAVYPGVFIEWIKDNQHLFTPGTIITDVTGVKGGIVKEIQGILRSDVEFIAAHPMAGRERSGVEFSDPEVFIGANYIITPTEKNTDEAITLCRELGRVLGFGKISELSTERHDEMIAYLSQLTHVIAVTLMTANDNPELEKYTGDSFRDLTRIAKINDKMWSELFLLNKDALLREIDAFSNELSTFRGMLESGDRDGMRSIMRSATERRTKFDKPKQ